MYMNKTKRNLILASAILNLIGITFDLIMSILAVAIEEQIYQFLIKYQLQYIFAPSNIIFSAIFFTIGLVGSIFLLYAVREKGKYYRTSYGIFVAGFIIIVVCGSFISWLLLFISFFVSDIVVINRPEDIRKEEKAEDRAYEEKKKQIEHLKQLRDSGVITEEEYKKKLFELL